MLWITFGQVLGGVGIFLLAISMLTQGLQMVSGNALKTVLARWTRTPAHGLALGVLATVVLQSSTVTVATLIGLVNAALLQFSQGIWVVFGANIGTTLTTWLVSAVGFDFNIKAFALPIVGVGMLLKVVAQRQVYAAMGTALTGIGLFFIGVDILKDAFSGYSADTGHFVTTEEQSFSGLLLFVLAGFVMTLITQSSSASLALILTSTAGGLLTVENAAAMIIGANLGTTSTAVIAVIGATANAKRTAAVHVIFNLITAVASLIALPLLLTVITWTARMLGVDGSPMVQLAFFHSGVKIFGVLLIWPIVPAMTRFLERSFVSQAEEIGRPKYLDSYTLNINVMALQALVHELGNLRDVIARMLLLSVRGPATHENDRQVAHLREGVDSLSQQIREYTGKLAQLHVQENVVNTIQSVLQVNRYLHDSSRLAGQAAVLSDALAKGDANQPHIRACMGFLDQITHILESSGTEENLYGHVLTNLRERYNAAKDAVLEAGAHNVLPVDAVAQWLDQLSTMHHTLKQFVKAERHLASLEKLQQIERIIPEEVDDSQPELPFHFPGDERVPS